MKRNYVRPVLKVKNVKSPMILAGSAMSLGVGSGNITGGGEVGAKEDFNFGFEDPFNFDSGE